MVLYFYFRVRYVIFLTGCFSYTLNMDVMQVILLTLVTQAAGLYYESSTKTTWYNAWNICEVALPDINIQKTETEDDIDINYDIRNGKVWVGYFSKMTSFEYIGCTSTNNLNTNKTFPNARNTPGLCYTACRKTKYDIVGISGDKCFCLREIPDRDIRQPYCNLTCAEPNLSCGGVGYISLYKVRKSTAPEKKGCYAFQSNKWSSWEPCGKPYSALCISNNSIHQAGYHAWNEYTNVCFSTHAALVTLEDKPYIVNATGPSWTNIVSSIAYYTYQDVFQDQVNDKTFGYVTNEKRLRFESNGNKTRNVLCLNESSSTIPTTPSSMPSTYTSVRTTYSTKWSSETMATNDGHTDIGVPIGISVAVLVLAVCGILAFIYIRKSGKLTACCRKEQPPTTKSNSVCSPSNINVNKTVENSSYDHSFEAVHTTNASQEDTAVNSDNNYAHTYTVLDDIGSQPVDEESTYNTITTTRPRHTGEQDTNVYNTLVLDGNATYDGVHTTKMVTKGHDQTYNTLTEATYAQTTSQKDKSYTTDEDTYNHISNSNSVTYNKQDSSYDI